MNAFGWVVTILGFIATIIGCLLAILAFINPIWRLKFYLKKPKKWDPVMLGRSSPEIWRYIDHPEFIIEIDYNNPKEWSKAESWMNHYPSPSITEYTVQAKIYGQVMLTEEFLSLDGGRYFIPMPRQMKEGGPSKYYYSSLQIDFARIVGKFYRSESIEEFLIEHPKISLKDK